MSNTIKIFDADIVISYIQAISNPYINKNYDNKVEVGINILLSGKWIVFDNTFYINDFSSVSDLIDKVNVEFEALKTIKFKLLSNINRK